MSGRCRSWNAGSTPGSRPPVRSGWPSRRASAAASVLRTARPVRSSSTTRPTEVWAKLKDPTWHCVVQIAPAVRVAIGEPFGLPPGANLTGQLYDALRRIGFKGVFDTNFGADVTIMEEGSEFVERLSRKGSVLPLITSCCPSWVDYMDAWGWAHYGLHPACPSSRTGSTESATDRSLGRCSSP